MEIKDATSIIGVAVALGLGIYNGWRTRRVARLMDSLLLDDRRSELLRRAIDTQALRTRLRTSLEKTTFRLRGELNNLSTTARAEAQKGIDMANKLLADVEEDIVSDRKLVDDVRDLPTAEKPDPALIQRINKLLGQVKERYSDARLQEARNDGLIVSAKNLMAAAKRHTEEFGKTS